MRRDNHVLLASCIALFLLAMPTRSIAGASILEPAPSVSRAPTGMTFGFWASSSQPFKSQDGVYDRSFKGGVALTWIHGRSNGMGVTVEYTGWRSSAAGAEWDHLFSIFSRTEIRGTEVTASGLRASFRHTQWFAPDAPLSPWIQGGAGVCRLSRKTVFPIDQLINSGWQVNYRGAVDLSYQPFIVAGAGFDVITHPTMRVGFDVSAEMIILMGAENEEQDPISSLMIGGHVLFGRWAGR